MHRAKTITGNIICYKKYTTKEAIKLPDKQKIETKVRDAFLVRELLQADSKPSSNTISLEDICKGEVNTQEDLVIFFLRTSYLTFNR